MGNNTLIKGVVIGIISLIILTIVMMVLVGKNGIINQEIKKYNDTHVEENSERQNEEVVEIKK